MAESNVQSNAQLTSTPPLASGGAGMAVGGAEGTESQDVGELEKSPDIASAPADASPALQPSPALDEQPAAAAGEEEDVILPELDETAIAFLTSPVYQKSNESVTKLFNLPADDLTFLNEMDHLVLGGSLDLREYVIALRGEFSPLDSKRKDELIARLLAERFLPWGDALAPSAQEVVREEKLALPSVPYFAVYVKPLTYGGAAGEVARMAGIGLAGQVRERLRDLIVSKVKGIRIDAQIEEQLARPADFGGLGLSKEQARAAMDAMNDILHRARVVTEEDYSAWLAEDMRRKAEAQASPVRPSPAAEDEDGAEIAAISSRMARPVRDTASVLALSVVTLVKRLPFKPDDEYSAKRLENIVSTRLRDVRSRSEVLMKLMRDGKVGGLGLERKEAEKIADLIEDGYKEFHGLIAEEEKSKLEEQQKAQELKVVERKKREAEEHARWFEEKIKSKRASEEEQQKLVEQMRAAVKGLTTPIQIHPLDVKERLKEKAEFGELVPAPAPTPVLSGAPTSVGVRVSAETVQAVPPLASGGTRPRLEDVKAMRSRLTGPVQELAALSLSSFRRMGKTPSEATARVSRTVELLSQESFERRVEAIRAWQSNPLQKTYVSLVTEAFASGTPVAALVEKKRAAGENVPTVEELAAIVELNGKLRL